MWIEVRVRFQDGVDSLTSFGETERKYVRNAFQSNLYKDTN